LPDTGEKWEYNERVHQLFVDFKKSYESVRRKVLYNIVREFGVPMKLVRLIKMCLNETYTKGRWAGHIARMGAKMNTYRILVGKPGRKGPIGRPGRMWEDNIKIDLREIGWGGMEWINLAQGRDQ
jgi:hypothetical protein